MVLKSMRQGATPLRALLIGLLAFTGRAGAFESEETPVSNPALSMPDPEFDKADPQNVQVAWKDKLDNLWVASVLADGEFDLANGQRLDSNLAPITSFPDLTGSGNGPEWVYTEGLSQILYTKRVQESFSEWEVYRAMQQDGVWTVGPFPDSAVLPYGPKGISPIGSLTVNDPDPAFCFGLQSPVGGPTALAWRKLDEPTGTVISTTPGNTGRWNFPGSHEELVYTQQVDGIPQVFLFNSRTLTSTQITFGRSLKLDAFLVRAPDLGGAQLLITAEKAPREKTSVGIYRLANNTWKLINSLRPPTTKRDLRSPEPSIYDGQTFVTVIAEDFKGDPSEVWLMGIRPDVPFFREVSEHNVSKIRDDPEFVSVARSAFVYFNETGRRTFRCQSGLGPPAANFINGTSAADSLLGTPGDDRIIGGGNSDEITGGLGADQFVYEHETDKGDVIQDFTVGEDLINLMLLMAEIGYTGSDPIRDGYLVCKASGADTVIRLDPDGKTGSQPAYAYLILKNVTAAAMRSPANFIL